MGSTPQTGQQSQHPMMGGSGMKQQGGFGGGFGGYGMPQQQQNFGNTYARTLPPQQQQGGYQPSRQRFNQPQQGFNPMQPQVQAQDPIMQQPQPQYMQQMRQEDPRMAAMRRMQQMRFGNR